MVLPVGQRLLESKPHHLAERCDCMCKLKDGSEYDEENIVGGQAVFDVAL